jgi:hypothetical protein
LIYQTLPSRWMADLFSNDTVELVGQFKSMYEGYNSFNEVINHLVIDSIDLSTTSISPIESVSLITVSPNPVSGNIIQVTFSDQYTPKEELLFQIIGMDGKLIQSGMLNGPIQLDHGIKRGVYYITLSDRGRLVTVKPFTIL